MTYKEEKRDLFSVPGDYFLAHCISADFALGKGIAVEFCKRYNTRNHLIGRYPNYLRYYIDNCIYGDCILIGHVLNLVTKERYFQKPTQLSMTSALCRMRDICELSGIKKVAMPTIGCGLDKMDWDEVSDIIRDVFKDTDAEVLVCKVK